MRRSRFLQHLHLAKWLILIIILATVTLSTVHTPTASNAQGGGTTYVVQSGENLFRIALRFNVSVEALVAANGITDPTRIFAGQVLTIPDASATTAPVPATDPDAPAESAPIESAPVESAPSAQPIYHIVEQGENLARIADRYGVAWTDIVVWNNILDANTIYVGQRLVINGSVASPQVAVPPQTSETTPVEAAPVEPTPTITGTYTVKRGDSLASIARQYGLAWTSIARVNNLSNPNTIFAGQVLNIPAADANSGTYFEPNGGVPSAPAPTTSTGKSVFVKLSSQQVYAYENGQLIRTTTASTGLPGTPTVTGDFRVYWKLSSQTMSGPGYYLPGVPYVMYFYQGYALHGTYWHNNFGQPMSHGCVNLPTSDAEWFFNWAEVGTPVHVEW